MPKCWGERERERESNGCYFVRLNYGSPGTWKDFPGGSDGKESGCNVGDPGF